ncbi:MULTISPECIES: EF-hand domain-containing protein [Pseudoalteromonas]|uniref:EF-hand domain-containing protein n=2 Tax=Pseudoalteromonas TaxID=53246 RepID=UPI002B2737C8|nr:MULTISPECIES: EF-hand domain-containing protein [Pseudoalteromonas]MEC4090816.1 EF-hand domain-containing protein [Pseudoalteromonas rubra]
MPKNLNTLTSIYEELDMYKLMLSTILMAASIGAHAADSSFSTFDTNGDGYISKSEAAGSDTLMVIFEKLDTNGDGKLSEQEFSQ